jgi:hypothetical protein
MPGGNAAAPKVQPAPEAPFCRAGGPSGSGFALLPRAGSLDAGGLVEAFRQVVPVASHDDARAGRVAGQGTS